MPKKPSVSIQRTGNYARNLKNVKLTRDSITKACDSVLAVKATILKNLNGTVAKLEALKRTKYDVYTSELRRAQSDLKHAMLTRHTLHIINNAVRVVECIKQQVVDEKKNVGEMNRLVEKAENVMSDCRKVEDQCLGLIKKATAISLSINPQKTSFILSRSTFDSNEFVPTDQLETIELDLSDLSGYSESGDYLDNDAIDDGDTVPQSQDNDKNKDRQRFKGSFEAAKVKRLDELRLALLREGESALTPQRTEVAIALYEKCLRILQTYNDSCTTWIKTLSDKKPEIESFFKSVGEQLISATDPLEYKHRIVTV